MDIFGLKDALAGTLRQCLCVKESTLDFLNTECVDMGDLNWIYSNSLFAAAIPNRKAGNITTIISTLYKEDLSAGLDSLGNMCFRPYYYNTNTDIIVKNTSYTDVTSFKNAMKGQLLVYEKASS